MDKSTSLLLTDIATVRVVPVRPIAAIAVRGCWIGCVVGSGEMIVVATAPGCSVASGIISAATIAATLATLLVLSPAHSLATLAIPAILAILATMAVMIVPDCSRVFAISSAVETIAVTPATLVVADTIRGQRLPIIITGLLRPS